MSSRETGFTLIEVMVALLLMAILSMLSWRALDSMLRTRDTLLQHGERDDELKALFNQWDKDCRAIPIEANLTLPNPYFRDDTETVLLNQKQFPNGVTRPILVIYTQDHEELVREESSPLNTRQQLLNAWSNALNHHLTPDLGLMHREVVLHSVASLTTDVFLAGKGWHEAIQRQDQVTKTPLTQDKNIIQALKLSVKLNEKNPPFEKICLTGGL